MGSGSRVPALGSLPAQQSPKGSTIVRLPWQSLKETVTQRKDQQRPSFSMLRLQNQDRLLQASASQPPELEKEDLASRWAREKATPASGPTEMSPYAPGPYDCKSRAQLASGTGGTRSCLEAPQVLLSWLSAHLSSPGPRAPVKSLSPGAGGC